jgi:hypothetical protein
MNEDEKILLITQGIISKLHFINNRTFYKKIRSRMASKQQQLEEFEDFDNDMTRIWFEAKEEYCTNKDVIDKMLLETAFSDKSLELIVAMRQVISDEMERMDIILLEGKDD